MMQLSLHVGAERRVGFGGMPWLNERLTLVLRFLNLLQLSVAVAPTNSQHIAWRLPVSGAPWAFVPVDVEDHIFGATATVNPSLPSTARLSSAEAVRTNHAGAELDFGV